MAQERITTVDFVKGFCVVGMLVHHTLNYFPLPVPLIKFVRFVTAAFPVLAGYALTQFYVKKYAAGQGMLQRLAARAAKLLLLFLVLNVFSTVAKNKSLPAFDWLDFAGTLELLFLTGDYRSVDFELLVPIAYTLLLGGMLVRACGRHLWVVHGISALTSGLCIMMPASTPGSYYITYTVCGLLGMSIGLLVPATTVPTKLTVSAVVLLWVGHLLVLPLIRLTFVIYAGVTILNLAFAWCIAPVIRCTPFFYQQALQLGQNSLYAYVVQIAILQVCAPLLRRFAPSYLGTPASFVIVTVCTCAMVALTGCVRTRSKRADKVYRSIFA